MEEKTNKAVEQNWERDYFLQLLNDLERQKILSEKGVYPIDDLVYLSEKEEVKFGKETSLEEINIQENVKRLILLQGRRTI